MKTIAAIILSLAGPGWCWSGQAADLKQAKLTQVVNDVRIISAAGQGEKTAAVNDPFALPDLLRTGNASRAELVAADETVTRVGANTIFSFSPANRTINLKQGSLLFHSPHGQGGGSVHTGSATASVLGSTLIVTTTAQGGFKVLALEDQAQIVLTNGHKLTLQPGQMTYVLPGGNQLSPVLIFRLDSLVEKSLLVKGFPAPLASLPLIQVQIDEQAKRLKSGKLTDTGLLAGDGANANQIEVLDLNSIRHNYNTASTALQADATLRQSLLTDVSVPTPPNHVFTDQPFTLANQNFSGPRTFRGFGARNIYFNPGGGLTPLTVDMDPYAGQPEFDFVAANGLFFDGPVTFGGLGANQNLTLFGGQQIFVAAGAALTANCADFELSAPGAFTMNGASLNNALGQIGLNFNGDINVQNGSAFSAGGNLNLFSVGNVTLTGASAAARNIFFSSLAGNLTLDGSTLASSGHQIFIASGAINVQQSTIRSSDVVFVGNQASTITVNDSRIEADSGVLQIAYGRSFTSQNSVLQSADTVAVRADEISLTGTAVQCHFLTLNSGDGILLDAQGKALTGIGNGAAATLTAPNLITVNNADFSSFATLNMVANTITLNGDTLAPISNFGTHTGQVQVNGPIVYGQLNLINCVWQNTPVTSAGQVTLTSGPGNTAGIYSYAR